MIMCARPQYFYKYTSSRSCKLILKSGLVKVSSPRILNDPFDNDNDLRWDFDQEKIAELLIQRIVELANSGTDIAFETTTPWSQLSYNLIIALRNGQDLTATFEKIRQTKYTAFDDTIMASQGAWQEQVRNDRLFCFSHQKDSPLLWAHYGDEFRGCILEFENMPNIGSPFEVATPVLYSNRRPSLGDFNEFFDNLTGIKITDLRTLVERYSNTKFIDWQYENEWRFTLGAIDPTKNFDLRGFDAPALTGIYFGPRMTKRRKTEIRNLAKPYRNCAFYEMKANRRDYAIEYVKVT